METYTEQYNVANSYLDMVEEGGLGNPQDSR